MLFGRQVPSSGRGGQSRPEGETEERNRQCDDALDEEQPLPSSTTADTVEAAVDRRLEVAREHGAHRVAHEPDACTLEQFLDMDVSINSCHFHMARRMTYLILEP